MATPGKAGTVFPAARITANPFATGIVVVDASSAAGGASGAPDTAGGATASARASSLRWSEPQSLALDQLDENALHNAHVMSAVTPGKGILKTPGKTPGGRVASVISGSNGSGGALGTPSRTPGKTPGGSLRPLALSKTPGRARENVCATNSRI